MLESKIAATQRLRREGRWEDACLWRDQARQRLRSEGKTRREASEESWTLMTQRFDPLSDGQIDWHEAAELQAQARFPIEHALVDDASEAAMKDVWWAYCTLQAFYSRLKKNDASGANFLFQSMTSTAPTPAAERLVSLAATTPSEFLDQVVTKFESATQRLERDDSVDKDFALKLKANVNHIREIRADLLARAKAYTAN